MSKLLDTVNTVTINVEKLPSDKCLHDTFDASTAEYIYKGDDIKINNTFIEFIDAKLYENNMTVFQIDLRKDIARYSPIQYYAVKDKYYTSTGLPIYRSFFDNNNGKDYESNVDKMIEDYNYVFNAQREKLINIIINELDGPVQPTINPSKQPVKVDYILKFCHPANMETTKNQPKDVDVISTINTYMTNYLLTNEIIFYNMTVEKVKDGDMSFNISYEVYPDLKDNATRLNGQIVDDYDFFESIYEKSGKVYDTCNPPYTECKYDKPDYLFEVKDNDVLVIAPAEKTQTQDIKYETRCSRTEIVTMDGGSFKIPNQELQLSVCRISCSSERHSNKSTSFTVRVKEQIDYKPSIDVSKTSKPVMAYVNQAFTIKVAIACPVVDRTFVKPTLKDVTMKLNWDIKDGDKSKYILTSDSIVSDIQKVSTSCDRTFTFMLNLTSTEEESSEEIEKKLNITITSEDEYKLEYKTELPLIQKSIFLYILYYYLIECNNADAMGVCCRHKPGELCTNMTTTFSFIKVETDKNNNNFKTKFLEVLDSVLFNNSHFWYTDISNKQDEELDSIEIKLTIKTNTININTIFPKRKLQALPDIPDISEFFGELTDKIDSIASNDVQEVNDLLDEAGTVLDPDKAITTESTLGITELADDINPNIKSDDNKSWAEKYWYVILIIVVVAVVLLSIIGVITYRAVDKTKVSRIEKKQLEICEKVIPIEKVKEKQGVSENDIYHPYEKTIILEGYLMKEGKAGYQRRYCVLYYNPSEMKLYESMTPSYYGNVYVGEKQSYKMESLKEVKYEEGSNQFNVIFKVNESTIKHYDNGENIRDIHFKVCKYEGENENETAKRWVDAFESYISGKPTVKSAWLVPVPLVRDEHLDGKLVTENSNVVDSRIMDTVVKTRANRVRSPWKKEVLKSQN